MDKKLRAKVNLYHPAHFLGFGFGSGLIPLMPGTMGSLAAIPLVVTLALLPIPYYLTVIALCFLLGVYCCDKISKDLGVHDHGSIVWDEVVGMMITFIAIPISWHSIILGFVYFRIFDILKPWPISFLDKHVHGGFGIMIDDVIAGIFAFIALFTSYYLVGIIFT